MFLARQRISDRAPLHQGKFFVQRRLVKQVLDEDRLSATRAAHAYARVEFRRLFLTLRQSGGELGVTMWTDEFIMHCQARNDAHQTTLPGDSTQPPNLIFAERMLAVHQRDCYSLAASQVRRVDALDHLGDQDTMP